jgi:hypothetical protein
MFMFRIRRHEYRTWPTLIPLGSTLHTSQPNPTTKLEVVHAYEEVQISIISSRLFYFLATK